MAKRFKPRDKIIQECVQTLLTTPSEQLAFAFNPIHWLSIGGMFLINGSTEPHQQKTLEIIRKANSIINNKENMSLQDPNELSLIKCLIVPQLSTTRMTLNERKGEMFSVKASEDCQIRAVARRAQLAAQSNSQKTLSYRIKGFESTPADSNSFEALVEKVRDLMKSLSEPPATVESVNQTYGAILKYTVRTIELIVERIFSATHLQEVEHLKLKHGMVSAAKALFKNGSLDLKVFDLFCGTYEDHGYVSKLLEYSRSLDKQTEDVLSVCEMLYCVFALEKTCHFLTQSIEESGAEIWRRLSEFFAKTIDDHFYEYNPWILDSKRGEAFVHFYDVLGIVRDEFRARLYEVSWRHHRVLYQYLDNLIRRYVFLFKIF